MTVKQLIEKLSNLPQDKPIVCQVCSEDGSAWNMFFNFNDVPNSWMVQLAINHPELITLPKWEKELL